MKKVLSMKKADAAVSIVDVIFARVQAQLPDLAEVEGACDKVKQFIARATSPLFEDYSQFDTRRKHLFTQLVLKYAKDVCDDAATSRGGSGRSSLIPAQDLASPIGHPNLISDWESKAPDSKYYKHYAALCLNGGLGSSMGCQGAKSLLEAKDGKTFLYYKLQKIHQINQKHGAAIPVILMNSKYTHEDTIAAVTELTKVGGELFGLRVGCFSQSMYPKVDGDHNLIDPDSLENPDDQAAPAGHGDLWGTLYAEKDNICDVVTGKPIDISAIQTIEVTNSDNIAAAPDARLIQAFEDSPMVHALQVLQKTQEYKKGGVLALINDKLSLLEGGQAHPATKSAVIENIHEDYPYFNTNNQFLNWTEFVSLRDLLGEDIPLRSIVASGKTVKQKGGKVVPAKYYESASGDLLSALRAVVHAKLGKEVQTGAIIVGGDRFLPVKTADALCLKVASDYFVMGVDGVLRVNPNRHPRYNGESFVPNIQTSAYKKTPEAVRLGLPYVSVRDAVSLTIGKHVTVSFVENAADSNRTLMQRCDIEERFSVSVQGNTSFTSDAKIEVNVGAGVILSNFRLSLVGDDLTIQYASKFLTLPQKTISGNDNIDYELPYDSEQPYALGQDSADAQKLRIIRDGDCITIVLEA